MDFNEYQQLAKKTLVDNNEGQLLRLARLTLGINGESGEVAEKIKKIIRGDHSGSFYTDPDGIEPTLKWSLGKELGDIL